MEPFVEARCIDFRPGSNGQDPRPQTLQTLKRMVVPGYILGSALSRPHLKGAVRPLLRPNTPAQLPK